MCPDIFITKLSQIFQLHYGYKIVYNSQKIDYLWEATFHENEMHQHAGKVIIL